MGCPTISHHTRVSQISISHNHALPYYIILYRNHIIYYHITISLSQMHPCSVCFLKSPFSSVKSAICVLWPRDTWLPVAISGPSLHGRPNCTIPSDETRQAAASWRYQGDIMGIYHQQYTNNMFWVYHWIGLREGRNSD